MFTLIDTNTGGLVNEEEFIKSVKVLEKFGVVLTDPLEL